MIYIGKDDIVQNLFTGERLWPTSPKKDHMTGNMKYYLRKDGKLVIPEVPMPDESHWNDMAAWERYVYTLSPVEGVIAEGFETGWLEGYEERYERHIGLGRWVQISKKQYDLLTVEFSQLLRIVLVKINDGQEKTPIQKAIEELQRFYDYGNNAGYSNTELSRISSCISKVKNFDSPAPVVEDRPKEQGGLQDAQVIEFAEWVSDNQFTKYNNHWKSTKIHYSGNIYTTRQLYQLFKPKS